MRECPLPTEFAELQGKVDYVTKVTSTEYSASCPKCGGTVHPDRRFPDRFRMMLNARGLHKVFGLCRNCGYTWWQGKESGKEMTEEELEELRIAAERRETEMLHQRRETVSQLEREKRWVEYMNNLTPELKEYYYKRGLNDFWILYWMLGYKEDTPVWLNNGYADIPSWSIPLIEPITRRVKQIKLRLEKGDSQVEGKYRNDYKGLLPHPFYCDLDSNAHNEIVIVEGEFKAMTTYITLDRPDIQCIGIPGNSPSEDTVRIRRADVLYLILDEDSFVLKNMETEYPEKITRAQRIIDILKENKYIKKLKVVRLPSKVDDMILDGRLDKEKLEKALEEADEE